MIDMNEVGVMGATEMSNTAKFTAAMCYRVKKEKFSELCRIWKDEVFSSASGIPGLISMQFLTEIPDHDQAAVFQPVRKAYAVGIWESIADAQNYMKTGVFENLLVRLDGILETPPESMPWDAVCYYSRGFLTE